MPTYSGLLIGWMPWLIIGAAAVYVAIRYVRAVERNTASKDELQKLQEQVLQLEERQWAASEGLDRLTEKQQFTENLLHERTTLGSSGPS